jgi:ATP-dependent Clp protease ATP-binding subunit ClpB
MQIDSKPQELDEIDRAVMQLEIEREALKKEKDEASKGRLAELESELANLKEQSAELASRWQTEREAITVVRQLKEQIEGVRTQIEQAERAYDLQKAAELRYGKIRQLEHELGQAEDRVRQLQSTGALLKEEVDADEIAAIVSKWTGVPVAKLLEGEREKLIRMEAKLHERVIGQEEAVHVVASAIRRSRAGLQDPNRPIGSFIFLGPTGVGKTELARALAEFLFDDEQNIVRIDMSEYQERHTVARLIGAPPGYVGYDEGGQLTEAVRRKPYSVVLLDEIEKAHPDVFNVLLQIMDDGRLTDGQGRTVDFKNAVVIMTSNLGSQWLADLGLSGSDDERRERVMDAVRGHFRPEFLNRVDEIIIFHPLSREHMREIAEIQLSGLKKRLAGRKIELELTDEAANLVIERGFDPIYGARPLKRSIQRLVLDPLAMRVLGGEFREGDTVQVSLDNGQIAFGKKVEAVPVGA